MVVSFSDLSPALKSLAIYGYGVMDCTIALAVSAILFGGLA